MRLSDIDTRGRTGQIKTFCPLCHEGRQNQMDPSLAVNLNDGAYKCHHCGEAGRLEDFKGTPFASTSQKEFKKPDMSLIREKVTERLPDVSLTYWKGRGISEATLTDWGVKYSRTAFPLFDKMGKRVKVEDVPQYLPGHLFPILERPGGEPVNVKTICPADWSNTGKKQIKAFEGGMPAPFGLHMAGPNLGITEGEVDTLSCYEVGFKNVMSMFNGAKSFNWLEIQSVVNALQDAENIYLILDTDEDGVKAREELVRRLGVLVGIERLRVVAYPPDCKDANDVLVKHGPAKLRECIDKAEHVPLDGISEMAEYAPEFLDFYENGMPKGIETGVPGLEALYRVMPGQVTIVTGVTNYGKSEVMDEIVRQMVMTKEWKFAFYSPENYPPALHMIKLAEKYIGKPFDQDKFGHMDRQEVDEALNWLNQNIFYINPRGRTYSVDEIIERARVLVYRKGINGLIIDPWNYVSMPPMKGGKLMPDIINEEMQKIGVFAKATGLHIWVVVHPRTLRKDKDGKVATPTVHDLYGGSKFGDNADMVFAVERNPTEAFATGIHYVTVHVQKVRYRYAGTQGNIRLRWDPFSGRLIDADGAVETPPDDHGITEVEDIADELPGFGPLAPSESF